MRTACECDFWLVPALVFLTSSPPPSSPPLSGGACLQVVVATPGRLWELIRAGQAHLCDLSHLSFLVMDEADRMVQQGHFQVGAPRGEGGRMQRVAGFKGGLKGRALLFNGGLTPFSLSLSLSHTHTHTHTLPLSHRS